MNQKEKPGMSLLDFSKLSLLDIINGLPRNVVQSYVSSLRGPDDDRQIFSDLKGLFQGFLRGNDYAGANFTDWITYVCNLDKDQGHFLEELIKQSPNHYKQHIQGGLHALGHFGGEVDLVSMLLNRLLYSPPTLSDLKSIDGKFLVTFEQVLQELVEYVKEKGIGRVNIVN